MASQTASVGANAALSAKDARHIISCVRGKKPWNDIVEKVAESNGTRHEGDKIKAVAEGMQKSAYQLEDKSAVVIDRNTGFVGPPLPVPWRLTNGAKFLRVAQVAFSAAPFVLLVVFFASVPWIAVPVIAALSVFGTLYSVSGWAKKDKQIKAGFAKQIESLIAKKLAEH